MADLATLHLLSHTAAPRGSDQTCPQSHELVTGDITLVGLSVPFKYKRQGILAGNCGQALVTATALQLSFYLTQRKINKNQASDRMEDKMYT